MSKLKKSWHNDSPWNCTSILWPGWIWSRSRDQQHRIAADEEIFQSTSSHYPHGYSQSYSFILWVRNWKREEGLSGRKFNCSISIQTSLHRELLRSKKNEKSPSTTVKVCLSMTTLICHRQKSIMRGQFNQGVKSLSRLGNHALIIPRFNVVQCSEKVAFRVF